MKNKQIIAAPAYLHETMLHQILDFHQTNALGNLAVVPVSALLPKASFSESVLLEKSFEQIQSCKKECPHFTSMIDNPSFLKQLVDFRNELLEYDIPLDNLPYGDEFQKELIILLDALKNLPSSCEHQLHFLTTPSSFTHVKLVPSYHHSLFAQKITDHFTINGAQQISFSAQNSVRIGYTALNRRQEMEACAQHIIEHHLSIEDINIVLCDPANDLDVLQLVFDRYGIPYGYVSKKVKSKMVKLFLSAVQFMNDNTLDSLLNLLHAGYSSLPDFDALINYIHLFVETPDEMNTPFLHVHLSPQSLIDERELAKLIDLEEKAEAVRQKITLCKSEQPLIDAYEFCRAHQLVQDKDELNVLYQIKTILEDHAQVLNHPDYLNLICFEIEQLSINQSQSIINTICITDLTHPVPARKHGFVMGCIQSSFPNFKECSGVFDEDYVSFVKGYPSKTERQKFNSKQTEWIFNCADTIIFSASSADYEGKGRQMSVEIESRLDQKSTPWKLINIQNKHRTEFKISEASAKQLFFKKDGLHGSVSSFERWFNCPASYFLSYGLKLRKQELPEFNIALMGTLQHAILEEAISRYQKKIDQMSESELSEIANQIFDPVIHLFKKQQVHLSISKQRCIKNMKLIFDFLAEMEANTDFEPKEQEKRFNFTLFENEIYPVNLHGIIDRIDMTHDMLRILDYKSSHKSLSASKIKSGLQLQLLTYLYIASSIYQKNAAGCYYVSLKNDDLKAAESKVDGRRFEVIDPEDNQDREAWIQSHRLDGMTFENTNMLDFDGRHIKNFKNGKPSKIYSIEDLSGFIHAIYTYLADQLANGNVSLTPTEDACMFCDHFGICRFHQLKVKTIVPEEIASHFFKEVKKP